MHRLAILPILLALLVSPLRAQSPSGVVVNEVFTGNPDWIEIANLSGTGRAIGGWQVQAVFGMTVYPAFTFPSGTVIAPGECIVVLENSGSTTSLLNPHPAATQVFNTNFGYGWIGTSTGAVAIIDDLGQAQDLVVFGTGPYLVPPGAGTLSFAQPCDRFTNDPSLDNVVYRKGETDLDSGADFLQAANGAETPGQPNPGQDFGPPPLAALEVADAGGAVVLDAQAQTLALVTTITGLRLANGEAKVDPAWDALIGGNLAVSAATVGAVNPDLAALLCVPAQIQVVATNGATLTMTGVIAAEAALEQELTGPFGTRPATQRAISSRSLSASTMTGTPSPALLSLQLAAATTRIYFVVRFETTGPRLVRVEIGRDPTAAPPALESRLASAGQGALEIGVIRADLNAVIFNVFVINPGYGASLGPVAGIDWGPQQWQQVFLPLPSPPFHVNPQAPGTYHFAAPTGTIPAGIWLDHVAIQLLGGLPVFSPPTRAFF